MGGVGIKKAMRFSDELTELTGKTKGSRAQATKWIWEFIKGNALNNKEEYPFLKNGQEIAVSVSDEMIGVFGNVKKITMFKIAGLLTPHLSEL